ncbi:BolA family protein [Roseospira goensis]|uniref:BolA protein n=1 Tax=Roseospira goensis TaxID=391922 RepID=A0A7W6RXT7_9PROT|nr:BolA family protein [Roseospira goensis]MBB4284559.1 BolA protein [Roseospira goensis]
MTAALSYRDRIEAKLTEGLAPAALRVVDDSHKHASHGPRLAALAEAGGAHGHAPLDGQGETHFRVEIVAAAFAGKSRVQRHRMVNALLTDELRERVHALAIKARTPEEAAAAPPRARA